jgi:hypothetical protein
MLKQVQHDREGKPEITKPYNIPRQCLPQALYPHKIFDIYSRIGYKAHMKKFESSLPDLDFDAVPLRERHDGWLPERQAEFIAALAETGCVSEACARVGTRHRNRIL